MPDTTLALGEQRPAGRSTAEQLGKPPQVLRGCGEYHLLLGTAQAPQPEPVEFQDALHMRKPHLDLLSLAA